jgi:hypothetical protein
VPLLTCGSHDLKYVLRDLRAAGITADVPFSGVSAEVWVPDVELSRARQIADRGRRVEGLKLQFAMDPPGPSRVFLRSVSGKKCAFRSKAFRFPLESDQVSG